MTAIESAWPPTVHAYGFSWRKRRILREFVAPSRVVAVRDARRVPSKATLLLWGGAPPPVGLADGVRLCRVEDGFLRSVGLGADLVRPLSWVFDDLGIYFDATRPSRLERLLTEAVFDGDLLRRAAELRASIARLALTKYNVGATGWARPAGRSRVILVPGQVESDASIRTGATGLRTNFELLAAVRAANPDAWVVYKPHPDVLAGLRRAGAGEASAEAHCDEVVTDVSMATMLDASDEVHVLTSLAGFEALLRGKQVVCYGMPFYAGWGLTNDLHVCNRRTRHVSIDELVAAALILYPDYVHPSTGRRLSPEEAVVFLAAWRGREPAGRSWWRWGLRKALALRAN